MFNVWLLGKVIELTPLLKNECSKMFFAVMLSMLGRLLWKCNWLQIPIYPI